MKSKSLSVALAAAALFIGSQAFAFHSGGVAECEGCHTMHNSYEGASMINGGTQLQAGPFLLKGSDQSSACLNCHEKAGDTGPSSYHISTPLAELNGVAPKQMSPGGDFGWTRKDRVFSVRGTPTTVKGERFGHNINSLDYGYAADSTLTTAPGGTFAAADLKCNSCHDPHGKFRRNDDGSITTTGKPIKSSGSYNNSANPDANASVGVFRILGGNGYSADGVTFNADPPAAVSPSSYNRTEATTQTRVAYGKGMSEWCANCHSGIHNSGSAGLAHPTGDNAKLGATIAGNYNSYVKSGDLTGVNTSSYSSLVPFEEGVADHSVASYTQLKANAVNNDSKLAGPDSTNSNVNCLSCHRAHASGFESMTRYNLFNEFMTIADASGAPVYDTSTTEGKINMGMSQAEQEAAYNGRPATKFAANQRNLCNKCHAKD